MINDAKKWSTAIDAGKISLAAVSWIDGQMKELEEAPEGPEAMLTMEKIKDTIQILSGMASGTGPVEGAEP